MNALSDATRTDLLGTYGYWYGEQKFAVAFTSSTVGEDAKRVTTREWDKTAPLVDGPHGAGYVAGRGGKRNPAIVLRPSNLIVLECDTEDDLLRIQSMGLPPTVTVRSSKPYKRHFYFRPAPSLEGLPYVAFRFESGKLTADSGRYFLAPPSIHPSGAIYAFLPGHGPGEREIALLPDPVYRKLSEQARAETTELRGSIENDPAAKIKAGNRRDLIFRYACMLRRWGLPETEILAAAVTFNEQRCDPPVERNLVQVQVAGAMKKHGGQELVGASDPGPEGEQPATVAPAHSWRRVDLQAAANAEPVLPTIGGLVYPGLRHLLSGEPESLKSWLALTLAVEQITSGHNVVYIDLETTPREMASRLRDLGITDKLASERFFYLSPDSPIASEGVLSDMDDMLEASRPTLVVVDAFTGLAFLHGCDPNKSVDVESVYRSVIRPLEARGAATLVVDHVPKDKENRGKFAIGSERKVGIVHVHIRCEIIKTFSKGSAGAARVTVQKDRPGSLRRPTFGELHMESDAHHRIHWAIRPAGIATAVDGGFRPTVYMDRVSRYLEKQRQPVPRMALEVDVMGKSEHIRRAAEILVAEGHAQESMGENNSRLIAIVKPYREGSDS